ncbi:hypothetical protein FH972_013143 [Carpinus fangiana]|nr:hypothetical protein FH972_013143 [Carpinus fangiana]
MYSKANSEAEYMDLKTLWERTNDAINTIIRRDESTENGKLLQPCIEAALNLGCTPRRASRSQRNSIPRCYLSPSTQEASGVSRVTVENSNQGAYTPNSKYVSRCPNFVKPTTLISTNPKSPVALINDCASNEPPFASENVRPSSNNPSLPMENYPASNFYSVYPLYYGNLRQFEEPWPGFAISNLTSNILEPAKMGVESRFCCNVDASYKMTETNTRRTPANTFHSGCDLSLRLGPVPVTCPSVGKSNLKDVEDVGSGSGQSPQVDKKLSFCPGGNVYGPTDSCSSKWSFEGKYRKDEATARKRKADFNQPAEDQQLFWQPNLPCSHLTGSMRNSGS